MGILVLCSVLCLIQPTNPTPNFPQNFLVRGAKTSLPTLIEECGNTKLLCDLATKTFDSGQAYSNSKVRQQFMDED